MKRGTPDHPKMGVLANLLAIPEPYAVGLMAKLWDWASRYTPAGDIGRYSNAVIAQKIGWPGDPDRVVDAMIAAGWLDQSEAYRFIVHDWPDHCEDSVHAQLARHGQLFADGSRPKFKKLSKDEREAAEGKYAAGGRKPSPAANGGQRQPTAAYQPNPSLAIAIANPPPPPPQPAAAAAEEDDEDDPQVIAKELIGDLMVSHPEPSDQSMAEAACIREMAKYKEQGARKIAESFRRTHRQHVRFWNKKRSHNPSAYVPQLHLWFAKGVYVQTGIGADTGHSAERPVVGISPKVMMR